MKRRIRQLTVLLVFVISGCASDDSGYLWGPGDEIKTDSTGAVVAPESIKLPQEEIDALNKL